MIGRPQFYVISTQSQAETTLLSARCAALKGAAFGVQTGLGQVESLPPGTADALADRQRTSCTS